MKIDKHIYYPLKLSFFFTCTNNSFLCKKDGVGILSNKLQNPTCNLEFCFGLFALKFYVSKC